MEVRDIVQETGIKTIPKKKKYKKAKWLSEEVLQMDSLPTELPEEEGDIYIYVHFSYNYASDAGRDWGQEEKGTTEDEMAGWHH